VLFSSMIIVEFRTQLDLVTIRLLPAEAVSLPPGR
jgi:hypothetical protein